jgi:NAD-dependent deacetylase
LERAEPNPGHLALSELERIGLLKKVITQNIDGLHEKAGSHDVLEYHGSVFKMRCVGCGARFPRDTFDVIKLRDEGSLPPLCTSCGGVVKGDTVGFGEPIPQDVYHRSMEEAGKCDLMLICGTSATVYPFAQLPRVAKEQVFAGSSTVTIIEVNAEPTPLTMGGVSDFIIQGMTGTVLPEIVQAVGNLRRS